MGYEVKSLTKHLDANIKPKRILCLDGGGIRGVLTLSYLKKIEEILKNRHKENSDFCLSDYFDLIAGTSTGAIIASALAKRLTVDTVQKKYRELSNKVFKRNFLRWGILRSKFNKKELEKALQSEDVLGELTTLGSPDIMTGLLIMSKRMDTCSPWPLTNNPKGTFYSSFEGSIANAVYPLWKVVRASTAAPHYFKPEQISVATDVVDGVTKTVVGDFVDGGVSTSNNPSLQTFMTATLKGFKLNWDMGADKILLISVGTGLRNNKRKIPWYAAGNALKAMVSLMDDCNSLVETMMQWMSATDTAREIDMEIGDLENDSLGPQSLLTYQRYNVKFKKEWMKKHLEENYSEDTLKNLERMDDPKNVEQLERIGNIAAEKQIKEEHFPQIFDL